MDWLTNIPQWLATALIGAAFAVAGYVGKTLVDQRKQRGVRHGELLAKLRTLDSLLHASDVLFLLQKEQIGRLRELLKKNHPAEYGDGGPHEDLLTRIYPVMDIQERTLHAIIRGVTEHSLRKVNGAMSEWLTADTTFKSGVITTGRSRELAAQLSALEIHLLLWHAKYESWIPNNPEHALVYLADENNHGLGFPSAHEDIVNGNTVTIPGVDDEVDMALRELQKRCR